MAYYSHENNTDYDEERFLLPSVNDSELQRQPEEEKSMSWYGAVFNIIATTVGTGIISLPGAIFLGGWSGLIVIVVTAILANFAAKKLVGCMHSVPGKVLTDYADIGRAAFDVIGHGWLGAFLAIFFQLFTLFGVCTIFLILAGGNLHTLEPHFGTHVYVLMVGAGLIPVAWLKTMKEISFLAFFGILASFFAAGVIIYRGIKDGGDDLGQTWHTDFSGISQAFNIIVFSYGGTSVIPTIADSMKNPRRFPLVANIAYLLIAVIYTAVAYAGYYGYGNMVSGNVFVSMDLDATIVKTALWFITAHVILAYPIPLNPINLYLEQFLGINKLSPMRELSLRIPLRTFVVMTTMFLASVIPYFGDVLSLTSAFSTMAMVFILPVLFYAMLNYKKIPWYEWPITVFIFLLGCVGTVAGVYWGSKALKSDIKSNPSPFDDFFSNKH